MNIEKIEINGHYVEDLSLERLKEVLNYNPDTGIFTWIKKPNQKTYRIKVGDIAGSINKGGYLRIMIDGKRYLSHRLAWFYIYKTFPKCNIDHVNHIKTDNKISNLREANQKENCKNRSKNKNNKSGYTGVFEREYKYKDKIYTSIVVRIRVNGKYIQKNFKSNELELALAYRKQLELKHKFHLNHGK